MQAASKSKKSAAALGNQSERLVELEYLPASTVAAYQAYRASRLPPRSPAIVSSALSLQLIKLELGFTSDSVYLGVTCSGSVAAQ